MIEVKKHIVITGTGRAGTTFLVELLTHLRLETGFRPEEIQHQKSGLINAGLEHTVGKEPCPYIVKDPWFCDYAEDILCRDDILIEHLIIPVRDIASAAASRRLNQEKQFYQLSFKRRMLYKLWPYPLDGGLWATASGRKGKQESILMGKVYNLVLTASKYQVPVTFIHFPTLTSQSEYLYQKLLPILNDISYVDFDKVFQRTIQPHLINKFS